MNEVPSIGLSLLGRLILSDLVATHKKDGRIPLDKNDRIELMRHLIREASEIDEQLKSAHKKATQNEHLFPSA